MPDFSYLDSSGIGQIETPIQQPKTLEVQGPTIAPPTITDFADIWKQTPDSTKPVPLFNDSLDMKQFRNKTAPRSFDADRLVPYKDSGAFKDLGYNPNMPEDKIQAQYDYDQSNWEATKSSIGSLAHVAGQSFANYFKTYGQTVKSLVNLNQQGIMYGEDIDQTRADNEAARANLRFKGDIPMHWYNYIPLPGLMKGDVAEELLPQLGFTIGTGAAAVLENLGVSLITGGLGEVAEAGNTASKLYKLISEYTTLGRGAELAKSLYKGPINNIRMGLDAWRLTNATLSETSMDAAQLFVTHKDKLIQDFIDKNGHAPGVGTDDMKAIDQNSHDAANAAMWGEFPVLAVSNFIQYRNLLSPTIAKKLAETEALQGMKVVNTAADKVASQFAVQEPEVLKGLKALGHGASHLLKNAVAEGLEEVGQNAVDNTASDYYRKLYNGKDASAMKSILEVGIPNLTDDDGLQNFMGGFVTGSIFHALGSIGNKLGTTGKMFNDKGELTGYKTNLFNSLGFGTEEIARANVKNQLQTVADVLNTEDLKTIFKEEGLADFVKSAQDGKAMNAALQANDLFNIGNLKSNALVRFLYTGLQTGKLDLRLNQLNAFRDLPQDKLNEFLGVDTGALNKQSTAVVVDHIIEKANQVKEVFDQEKERFSTQQKNVNGEYQARVAQHQGLEQSLRTKYNLDANQSDIRGDMADLLSKQTEGTKEQEDIRKDAQDLHESTVSTNRAFMNMITVREGTKAAIFASVNMDIDGERSREMIRAMQERHTAYMAVDKALSTKDLDIKTKDLDSQVKAMTGVDNERALELHKELIAAQELKAHLASFYGDEVGEHPYGVTTSKLSDIARNKVAASALYNYMNLGVDDKDEPIRRKNRLNEEKALGILLNLEKKNKDNLSLYNRLTQSDKGFEEYSKQETDKTARTIGQWTQAYLNKKSPEEEETKAEPEATPVAESTVQQPAQTTQVDDKLAEVKQKVDQQLPLTQDDQAFLNSVSTISDEGAELNNKYIAQQPTSTAVVATTEDTPVHTSEIKEPGAFTPEPPTQGKAADLIETTRVQEHNGQVIEDPNRTIVNELAEGEFNKTTPKLEGGYTAWKQKFFDYVGQNDLLDRFTGKLVVDSIDNYPANSTQYLHLQAHPESVGLVLIITDKNGNDRFDNNYLPDKKGQKIVHSLPNSPGKTALLATLKEKNSSVNVDLARLSQGIFDELDKPRATSQLVEGISEADYQFMIAQGPKDSVIYHENGMALRNGGAYIKTQGSYIKLLPNFVGSVIINGENLDPTSLVGRTFATKEEAIAASDFLQKLFYTDRAKDGLQFYVYNAQGKFNLVAKFTQGGKAVTMTSAELLGVMRSQRLNIDKNSIGTDLQFMHVVDDKVVTTPVSYNQFLKDNTQTNKKAYETAEGKKVLKPVNRYMSLSRPLYDLNKEIQEPVQTPKPPIEPKDNSSLTKEPIKPARRRFDTNQGGFDDIDKLLKRKEGTNELTVPMQEEAEWINRTFNQPDLAIVKSVINAGAWGTWSKAGIELLENAPKGTGYHEAWHHFSQLYLTVPQREVLYNEVRDKVPSLKDAPDRDVEEHVAEDFSNYTQTGQVLSNAPQRNSIFRQILDFLRRVFNRVLVGARSLDRLYKDLYEGNLSRYSPSPYNAQFGKLNSKLTDSQGNEIMNNQKSFRFLNHMESVAGEILSKAQISPAQFMTGDKDIDIKRKVQLARQMQSELSQQANDLDDEITAFEAKNPSKSTPLLDTYEDLTKVLDNFPAVFRQYYDQSAYRSSAAKEDIDIQDLDSETTEQEEVSNAGKGWDVAGNEESVLDSASAETKALIRGLSKVQTDRNGDPVKVGGKVQLFRNEYGLNEPVVFTRTMNNLANLLEGSFSYQEMLDKVNNKDNQRRFPELSLLSERLPDHTQPLKITEVKQLSSFLKNFSKTYVPVYTLVRLLSGEFIFREETRRSQDLVERTWSNNFFNTPKDSQLLRDKKVLFDENDRPYINPQAPLDYNFQSPQDRRDFLSLLGVQINPRAEDTKAYEDATKPEKLGFLLQSIRKRLAAGQKMTNPVSDLRRAFSPKNGGIIFSEKTTINAIVGLESKFTDTNPSMSFRNSEGNMQHGLSENNWVTNTNYHLSRVQNYSQIANNPNLQHLNIANNPYIAHSLFLNRLFNLDPTSQSYGQRRRVNGEPVTTIFGNYNGMDVEQEGANNKGTSTVKLTARDKLIMDINSFLLNGAVEMMRTESSSSAFFYKLSDYASQDSKEQDLPVSPYELDADPRNEKVLDYFRGAVQDELATIINKYNSPLPSYNSNIGRFTMFDGILGKETKDSIMSELIEARDDKKMSPEEKQAVVDKVYRKYGSQIDKEVGDFLENEIKDFNSLLRDKQIGYEDMSKTLTESNQTKNLSMQEIATAFVVNDFILNSEFIKLMDGNVGFFKAYHKRAKGNTSTGVRAATDDFLKGYLDGTKERTIAGSLGDKSDTNLNETKTVTFKDDNRVSVYTKERSAIYFKALKAIDQADEQTMKLVESKFNNMNVADGQGHATLDFYREMRMRVANWSFADEVQYQKEVIGYRERKGLYGTTIPIEQRDKDQQFLKDYASTSSTFPPMKMQYNGALKMPGVFAPVLDKFSIMPLIPSVIAGSLWDDIHDKLVREGIGYTKFESGTKKYKYTPQEFYTSHEGFTASVADTKKPYNSATHFAEGLKEQLRTNSEPKDEATWGTQMRKLFLTNLFNSGIADQKFRSILDRYINILNTVQDQQKQALYKEFGIKEYGDDQVSISDVKGFVKTLQSQVNSRALNDNIRNFIQYDPSTKSFVYPLEVSLNKSQVQDLISGMIFNRLTRLKVNGDMLIQVASSGFEAPGFKYTNATEEDNMKYGSNGLPFYEPTFNKDGTLGNTKPMRVKIAMIKEWTKLLNLQHTDGKKVGTVERMNELLRDDAWREANRKKITLIGYRIPTQGTNSLEFMEVHEFLPSVAGSIVILPAEIVAKSGSDYDIDKMPIIRPSFTEEGELAVPTQDYEKQLETIRKKVFALYTKEKEINSGRLNHEYSLADGIMDRMTYGYDAEEIENEIDSLLLQNDDIAELLHKYKRVASNRQGAYTNQVIDLYKEVLESPEMFKQLITPNNVDLAKPVAQEIAKLTNLAGFDTQGNTKEFTNTDVLKVRSNNVKFEQLLSGKRDVAIFAKANTMSQLLQQSGMTLSKSYKILETVKGTPTPFIRKFTQLLLSPEERKNLDATKADADGNLEDRIDYSSNVDVSGKIYKQEYLSQLINGTVDVAGDPWYAGLRLPDITKGVLVHMINQGIPLERAVLFLNHPTIQRYANALSLADPTEKWNVVQTAMGEKNTRGAKNKMLNLIEAIDTGKNFREGFYFKEEELRSHIKDPSKVKDWYSRQVLAHFLKQEEQAKILRKLQGISSFDTQKYMTPISAQQNLNLRKELDYNNLFDKDSVSKIQSHSMISAFNNVQKSIDIFSQIMPTGMNKAIIEASAELMDGFQDTKARRIRLERTLNNDWIEFIIKNYGQIEGQNFEDYAKNLIIFKGDNIVLATRLTNLKNTIPALKYFDVFNRLYNNYSEKSKGWRNIELYRGLENTSDYQNILIEELSQLANFQGTEVPGKEFSPQQVGEIRDFFTKLAYLAFQQSGFNKSALFFTDVVPSDLLAPIFKQALDRFNSVINDPQKLTLIINDFTEKFKEQNPTFVFNNNKKPFKESWRGKLYKLGDDTEQPGEPSSDYGDGGPSDQDLDDLINGCL